MSQYKVRDTFCKFGTSYGNFVVILIFYISVIGSYGIIELCTKALSSTITTLKQRNVNLASVRTCVVVRKLKLKFKNCFMNFVSTCRSLKRDPEFS